MLVHRFINFGTGNAGLGDPVNPSEFVLLMHPDAVMDASIRILSAELAMVQNSAHSSDIEILPPLVRNVVQLITETMKATRYIYKN